MAKKKPNGYWNKWENLDREIKIFFQENPQFTELPSQRTLYKLGYSVLPLAITKNKGFAEVRKRLGHANGEKVGKGKWKDIEFTLDEARRIMKELGLDYLPEQNLLNKKGYSSLCNAIYRYHGGFTKFRKLLGQKSRKSPRTWQSLDSTLEYARDFLRQHPEYDKLPSVQVLRDSGEHGFVSGIYDHHGGYARFRRLLEGVESEPKLEDTLEAYVGGKND